MNIFISFIFHKAKRSEADAFSSASEHYNP